MSALKVVGLVLLILGWLIHVWLTRLVSRQYRFIPLIGAVLLGLGIILMSATQS
ncbi:MAG: hypothetical protein M1514_01210 [Patescibacteria group bacterium]|nr:hypothetical protein [Patescibacteria group bacterium]